MLQLLICASPAIVAMTPRCPQPLPVDPPSAQVSPDVFTQRLTVLLDQWMTLYDIPGVAWALIEDGETRAIECLGWANRAENAPITQETVFNVGSVSKTIAAWGIMQLAHQGKLDLDAPVHGYLTSWALPDSPFESSGVTARSLLSHTAGISRRSVWGMPRGKASPLRDALRADGPGQPAIRQVEAPGRSWRYSGGGYGILQLLIEDLDGRSFAEFMRSEVLLPMGMTHSDFEWTPNALEHAAVPYDNAGHPFHQESFSISAAAGLQTTVRDMATFTEINCRLLANQDGAPVTAVTPGGLARMVTPQPGTEGRYGLGYFVETLPDGTTVVGHDGSNTGWNALALMMPRLGSGIVVLTNSSRGRAITNQVRREWYVWKARSCPDHYLGPPVTEDVVATLFRDGVDAAVLRADELRRRFDGRTASEGSLNFLGYELLWNERPDDAISVFELVTRLFPDSENALDSLAEAFEAVGQMGRAELLYRRILEMNPESVDAQESLRRVRAGG